LVIGEDGKSRQTMSGIGDKLGRVRSERKGQAGEPASIVLKISFSPLTLKCQMSKSLYVWF